MTKKSDTLTADRACVAAAHCGLAWYATQRDPAYRPRPESCQRKFLEVASGASAASRRAWLLDGWPDAPESIVEIAEHGNPGE